MRIWKKSGLGSEINFKKRRKKKEKKRKKKKKKSFVKQYSWRSAASP